MDYWRAEESIVGMVKDLVVKHHPHLIDIVDEILVLFKEKGKETKKGFIAGESGKVPNKWLTLSDTNWTFCITLAQNAWDELDQREKKALLDHHLCAFVGEEDKKTGMMKYSLDPPDVSFYKPEIERYGFWRTSGTVKKPSEESLREVFGDDIGVDPLPNVGGAPTPPVAPSIDADSDKHLN